MKKIISVVGARPQFIKLAPMSAALRTRQVEHIVVHTGQHYDDNMSAQFFRELDLPEPQYHLDIHGGDVTEQVSTMMAPLKRVLEYELPDIVFVYGDTSSTLAGAIVAKQLGIQLLHIEAGLRSFDMQMPEELNRVITDRISDIHSCPTKVAYDHLVSEGIANCAAVDGDIMYDAVLHVKDKIENNQALVSKYRLDAEPYIVLTIHRNFNTDVRERLDTIIHGLVETQKRMIFPVHPRTAKVLDAYGLREVLDTSAIECINPLGYVDMLTLVTHATHVITDSGGLQKEAYMLQKPCLTLRKHTEWSDTLAQGWNRLAWGDDTFTVETVRDAVLQWPTPGTYEYLYGDGTACQHILTRLGI
jgi:UDP-N-acetylglucosamine 2-epimerase